MLSGAKHLATAATRAAHVAQAARFLAALGMTVVLVGVAGDAGSAGVAGGRAVAQVCTETPGLPAPLGSPSGCDYCLYYLLPGAREPAPPTAYTILSDLPERLLETGVLYATVPVLPADRSGEPILAMRTQVASGGFVTIDDSFDVLLWHTTEPTDGSAPRRIVVYARNDGTAPVTLSPQQIILTDGSVTGMAATLGTRVLAGTWDGTVAPTVLPAGTGAVLAYSKQFAASSNGSDTSTGPNCFGRVRALVANADPGAHPTNLRVHVVAIDGASPSQNLSRAEALLNTGATSGDPFDLNVPPSGCANRRAAGVHETFAWRAAPLTLDVNDLPDEGVRFRMTLGVANSQTCPAGRQTADLVLRPGYVRPDTVGNYMVEYRAALRLINANPVVPQPVDVRFGNPGAALGLAWQVAVDRDAVPDGVVDARPARGGWTTSPSYERSLLEFDGGPLILAPCQARTITLRFVVLGASTLPFQLSVVPGGLDELVVDNRDAGFSTVGTWPVSANPGHWEEDSQYHAGDGGASSATWAATLPATGWWSVSAWWVTASNRSPLAPYTVPHAAGSATVYVNQRDSATANRWNRLGDWTFAAGSAPVTLRTVTPAGEYVSADAVRWRYLGPVVRTGDVDGDGDVDAADLAAFAACLDGSPGCDDDGFDRADANHDLAVDLADYGLQQAACCGD